MTFSGVILRTGMEYTGLSLTGQLLESFALRIMVKNKQINEKIWPSHGLYNLLSARVLLSPQEQWIGLYPFFVKSFGVCRY